MAWHGASDPMLATRVWVKPCRPVGGQLVPFRVGSLQGLAWCQTSRWPSEWGSNQFPRGTLGTFPGWSPFMAWHCARVPMLAIPTWVKPSCRVIPKRPHLVPCWMESPHSRAWCLESRVGHPGVGQTESPSC